MKRHHFPPFPAEGEKGPQVCASVCFYLAIREDLSSEQRRILDIHVQECPNCAAQFRLLQQATRVITALPESAPSAHVDKAILGALQSQKSRQRAPILAHSNYQFAARIHSFWKNSFIPKSWPKVLAATCLLFLLVGLLLSGQIFSRNIPSSTFQLPAHLSWQGYVLHYTQMRVDAHGKSYQVEVYQDLGTDQMHTESTMPGQFDVVVISDTATILGEDMMHHVAQMGSAVKIWAVDGSLFDLAVLRQDLATHHAIYLGKGRFQNQDVYQVRVSNGQVLLLNMDYLPVGALYNLTRSSAGIPLYTTCVLMSSAQISHTMWNMQIPSTFHMGNLPSQS